MAVVVFEDDDVEAAYAQLIVDHRIPGVPEAIFHMLSVPREHRLRGIGRRLLRRVLDWADTHGQALWLAPVPLDPECPVDLTAWYARYGFEPAPQGTGMVRPALSPPGGA